MKRRTHSAFTLIELIVVATVSTLVLSIVADIYCNGVVRYTHHSARTLGQRKIAMLNTLLTKDIRNTVKMTTDMVGSNTVYTFTFPVGIDAIGNATPAWVGHQLNYNLGAQVRYYLSDTTGDMSITGGSIIWRATAPAGSTVFIPDTAWTRDAGGNYNFDDITSFTMTQNSASRSVYVSAYAVQREGSAFWNVNQWWNIAMRNTSNASIFIPINPKATFYQISSDPSAVDATPVDLQANGIAPGDTITIQATGCLSTDGADDATAIAGVFSSSPTLLAASNLNRVSGAIAPSFTSDVTALSTSSNIAEDFTLPNGAGTIVVPAGARYLFVTASDSYYSDNTDPNNDFGVQVLVYP